MFKLKLINKPKMMKLKCNFTFPNIVLANLQEKEVTPSKEIQEVIADKPYDGLSKVTVDKIPEEYIIPVGTKEIETNGNYDVREYANASVNVPDKLLGTKTITANGTYLASDDNLDGYSSVSVETGGGIDSFKINNAGYLFYQTMRLDAINELCALISDDCENYTNMFYACRNIIFEIPYFKTANAKIFQNICYECRDLTSFPQLNTKTVTNFASAWYRCTKLASLPELDFSSAVEVGEHMLYRCSRLTTLGGFKNFGKSFTQQESNYSYYALSLSDSTDLTHESLMNVINDLYDLNISYNVANGGTLYTQKLVLGSTNLSKLTAEEINIATERGWTVS